MQPICCMVTYHSHCAQEGRLKGHPQGIKLPSTGLLTCSGASPAAARSLCTRRFSSSCRTQSGTAVLRAAGAGGPGDAGTRPASSPAQHAWVHHCSQRLLHMPQ